MIEYQIGNLIEKAKKGAVDMIAHCANCMNSMKSGIAPQIVQAFPWAGEADLATVRGDRSKLGGLTFAIASEEQYDSTPYNCPAVFNLYGQYGFWNRRENKRDLDYDALYNAFEAMQNKLVFSNYQHLTIGLPGIGAGLAGGNWRIISAIIEETICKTENRVIVYSLNEQAQQGLLKYVE